MHSGQGFDRRKYDSLDMSAKIDLALEILEDISYAFPDGPIKHREAHEAMILAKKAEAEFWTTIKLEIAKKGTWGLIVILLGLVLVGLTSIKPVWFLK